jgi:hypothetical protein
MPSDVSDSMGDKVSDQALAWVMQTVQKKPQKDEAGLVVLRERCGRRTPAPADVPI